MSVDGKGGKTWALRKSEFQPQAKASLGSDQEKKDRRFFTLSQIQDRVAHHLQPALSAKPFWIVAELAGVNFKAGNLYCELAESRDGQLVAKLRCKAWRDAVQRMSRRFLQNNLTLEWENGSQVGLLCQLEYHRVYGLSLKAVDIDPDLALGDLERRRRKILDRLTRDGLLELNGRRPLSLLPARIGLIASRETAGCKDFLQTLELSQFGFTIFHADVRVQGTETQASVLRGLKRLQTLNLDLIVLVRGGGSRTDLGYLDNELIAREIAHCAVPVWTGIGHETDTSVLDAVAAKAFRTPSAVAGALVARFDKVEHQVAEIRSRLLRTADLRVAPARRALSGLQDGIRRASQASIQARRHDQRTLHFQFSERVFGQLGDAREQLTLIRGQLTSQTVHRVGRGQQALASQRVELVKATQRQIARQRELSLGLAKQLNVERLLQKVSLHRQAVVQVRQRLVASSIHRLREKRTGLDRERERLDLERFLRILHECRASLGTWRLAITSQSNRRMRVGQLALAAQRLELIKAAEREITRQRDLSARLASELGSNRLPQRLSLFRDALVQVRQRFVTSTGHRVQEKRKGLAREVDRFRLQRFLRILIECRANFAPWLLAIRSADPQTTLERGFAMVYDEKGVLVTSINSVRLGQRGTVRMRDGKMQTRVEEIEIDDR